MSAPVTIRPGRRRTSWHRLLLPWCAVLVARTLANRPPAKIRSVLVRLRGNARPSTYEEAARARAEVVTVSTFCAGEGCLPRAIATALLCRARGSWPTWCSGVRVMPFLAHAWVEVDGEPVDEPQPAGYHHALIRIPPKERSAHR
ncbi:lasso peptide biosynthesis B2 protein [Streptomyces sp. NPDC017056]|uniref:lasso peptide biosynthesis B2 protein n=1 Tax=Streptomyces sp. NPDC017056 TaxID=3364973 RepID=UPI0037AD8FD4